MRARDREQQLAQEHHQQPAADAGARAEASGGCAPSTAARRRVAHCRAELPVPDPDRAQVQRPQVRGDRVADGHRAMEATGAADGDGEARLALRAVGGHGELQELVQERQEPLRDRLPEHERADRLRLAGQLSQLRAM